MAKVSQAFNHNTPAAPTLTGGMLLGSSGVTHPPLLLLGDPSAAGSADTAFNDGSGLGQFDTDSDGNLYICDNANFCIKKYTFNATTGTYTYQSKVTSLSAFGSGSVFPTLLAIDKSVSPNQIHLGARTQFIDNTWIGVWPITAWSAGISVGTRLRSYGSNSASDVAQKARQGETLTIDATYAVVTSASSPNKNIRWNHLTNTFMNEESQSSTYARFATDGAGKWWSGANVSGSEVGLHEIDVTTFTGVARLDGTGPAGQQNYRRGRSLTPGNFGQGPAYHGGRVYWRLIYGGVLAFDATTRAPLDEFLWAGALQSGNYNAGAAPSTMNSGTAVINAKHQFVTTPGSDYYVAWGSNADNDAATQSHLLLWPVSTTTATWTKTDWSSGTNTLQGLYLDGSDLAAAKCKVRLRKNSGAWITLVAGLFTGSAFTTAIATLGTFTAGDTLTVELSLSIWNRLDGHATLTATRDKLSPSNVHAELLYNDTAADISTPTAAFTVEVGGTPSFQPQLNGTPSFQIQLG